MVLVPVHLDILVNEVSGEGDVGVQSSWGPEVRGDRHGSITVVLHNLLSILLNFFSVFVHLFTIGSGGFQFDSFFHYVEHGWLLHVHVISNSSFLGLLFISLPCFLKIFHIQPLGFVNILDMTPYLRCFPVSNFIFYIFPRFSTDNTKHMSTIKDIIKVIPH